MSLLDDLDDPQVWERYLAYKLEKGHLSSADERDLQQLIACQGYVDSAQALQAGSPLPPPEKIQLSKLGTERKRVVYAFAAPEVWVLKLLAWLLFRFDQRQPQGCYSFRRNYGVQRALKTLINTPQIDQQWCCKMDISDYFNSIDVSLLLQILEEVLADDPRLLAFFTQLLSAGSAVEDGALICERHGVMAGNPTAPFLANLYLRALDGWFCEREITYARYSDDIIFFAPSKALLEEYRATAEHIIGDHGLVINNQKSQVVAPGQAWEFLGISYQEGAIDLSLATRQKIKGKIRRKARALRRWMLRKEASPERACRAFFRSFNRKFFDCRPGKDLSWARWFFPLLNRSAGLAEVDTYLQQHARWIFTGRTNAGNFRVSHHDLKALGYCSLVHEYYRYRSELQHP